MQKLSSKFTFVISEMVAIIIHETTVISQKDGLSIPLLNSKGSQNEKRNNVTNIKAPKHNRTKGT